MSEKTDFEAIPFGSVVSPKGFFAGAAHAGIKDPDPKRLDLGVLFSEVDCQVAGLFTRNKVQSAPVRVCKERLAAGHGRVIVVNSGCANASTGERGMEDAKEMTSLMCKPLGVPDHSAFVASTGVIGVRLPMDKIRDGLSRIALTREGGHDLAHAMMTTDLVEKECALAVKGNGFEYIVAGVAKGSGMIHPDMATMLCFITTDARVEASFLQAALKRAADISFNMITVDGDTSPSDTVLLLANGAAGIRKITAGTQEGRVFQRVLNRVCTELAKSIARDGEGAKRLIEVTVEGARSTKDARVAARTIAGSSLVKTAVYGADPNWGRVVAALGRSGAQVEENCIDVYLGDQCVMRAGAPQTFDTDRARKTLKAKEVKFGLSLNLGRGKATAWGCDLTPQYVRINSDYTT
ncbi:MAG: bifunctional glutamate N-acetyltransferase/amino-acid acetyltransferase ArgJ [Dehalococcoidia bacterium]|nr:bifunctional glutamate N-acetyltransferase/amino-acid acetyltransferase ArgJ [Dehalococcoidia bacterium]